VERKDVGISLKIKPHINEGSTLRLEVEQENSEIAPAVSGLTADDLITNKRSLKSTILADDGEIIVIGGLIKDTVRSVESSVPYLGRIPLIGGLFRSSKDTHTKTNLMVFLRPTIVRSKQDIAEISKDRYNDLRILSKPGARQNNSLLLPRDPHQLFEGADENPMIDLRKTKVQTP
jgi:general secretion pathway protein D